MTEFFKLIFQLILLFLTQAFIAVGTPFLFLVLYLLQKLYMYVSRQIKLLDIELRAEDLSNFLETVRSFVFPMLRLELTSCSSKGCPIFVPLAGNLNPSVRTSRTSTYPNDLII